MSVSTPSSPVLEATDRTTVKRHPERASYDRELVHAILDEAFVCHLGFATPRGPVVVPTAYGRDGDTVLLHGSPASRMLRTLKGGVDVCCTVTIVDGLVLARSTFHHSINYRSVVLFGTATEVTDPQRKSDALARFVEHVVPGRTGHTREASAKEVKGTTVLELPIVEVSAKVRRGGPVDEPEDHALDAWAGVVPLITQPGGPIDDAELRSGIQVPAHVAGWTCPGPPLSS